MNSWLIITVLTLLLIIIITKHLLFRWEIKNMTKQLEEIIDNIGTNELVRTNTHHKSLVSFTTKINQLIHLFKQDQQHTLNRELKLKQEITNISHDLRTPLTSIKGFSELIADPSLSRNEKQQFLKIIQKKVENLTTIVDLFYELSQLDSSDMNFNMDKQSLEQHVVDTMLLFYEQFEKKQIKVIVDEQPVSYIYADENAINRIIHNIIQNALSYAKSYVSISLLENEQNIQLKVVNDIDLIHVDNIERIFERTFQLDSSRTGSSLGLGLHIVKELINKQGGEVFAHIVENEFIIEVSFKKWLPLY